MPIWNRQHGECNFLLKWFVRMSLCTYGSQSLPCHRYIDRESALRHCMPTPVKYPAPVTSISTCPFSCVTGRFAGGGGGGGRGLAAVTIGRITGCAVCHDPAEAVYTDGTPACGAGPR